MLHLPSCTKVTLVMLNTAGSALRLHFALHLHLALRLHHLLCCNGLALSRPTLLPAFWPVQECDVGGRGAMTGREAMKE